MNILMKKILISVLLFSVPMLFTACSSDDSETPVNDVTINGSFSGGTRAVPVPAVIIVFNGGSYDVVTVDGGSFSFTIEKESVLVFTLLDGNSDYLGTVKFSTDGSLGSLPLNMLKSGVDSLDLTIDASADDYTVAQTTLTENFNITDEGIIELGRMDDTYVGKCDGAAQNYDPANADEFEVLVKNNISLEIEVSGGNITNNGMSEFQSSITGMGIANYQLNYETHNRDFINKIIDIRDNGTFSLADINAQFSTPINSGDGPIYIASSCRYGYDDDHDGLVDNANITSARLDFSSNLPVAGDYIISFDDGAGISGTQTFVLPDQSNLDETLLIVKPTVTLAGGGSDELLKITWELMDIKGNPVSVPEDSVSTFTFEIKGTSGNNIYKTRESISINSKTYTIGSDGEDFLIQGDREIAWSEIESISFSIHTLYGNQFSIIYEAVNP